MCQPVYFWILVCALQLLADMNTGIGVKNFWDLSEFLSQMLTTSALLGLIFEYPIVLTLLTKMGFMSADFLRKKRRFAYFLVFCLVSLLPPTDGVSLVVMSLPLVILYEVTILINSNNQQKHVWTRN